MGEHSTPRHRAKAPLLQSPVDLPLPSKHLGRPRDHELRERCRTGLMGMEMEINDWSNLKAGDDAEETKCFNLQILPPLAFHSHTQIVNMYKEKATP